MRATAKVFFAGDWQELQVKPRFSRFLVGPSGSGKTHLVRTLATDLGIPLYSIDATSWMPFGASDRAARSTWGDIAQFLGAHRHGIIFVDELDKLGGAEFAGSSWVQFLRVEIFSLLDRRIPPHLALAETAGEGEQAITLRELGERLRDGMMLVGAGAFQAAWEKRAERKIGLLPAASPRTDFTQKDMQTSIPAELSNRFAGPILVLEPLREEHYRQLLRQVTAALPEDLAARVVRNGRKEIHSAVENGLGVRWVEEILLKSLLQKSASETKGPQLFSAAA